MIYLLMFILNATIFINYTFMCLLKFKYFSLLYLLFGVERVKHKIECFTIIYNNKNNYWISYSLKQS